MTDSTSHSMSDFVTGLCNQASVMTSHVTCLQSCQQSTSSISAIEVMVQYQTTTFQ